MSSTSDPLLDNGNIVKISGNRKNDCCGCFPSEPELTSLRDLDVSNEVIRRADILDSLSLVKPSNEKHTQVYLPFSSSSLIQFIFS